MITVVHGRYAFQKRLLAREAVDVKKYVRLTLGTAQMDCPAGPVRSLHCSAAGMARRSGRLRRTADELRLAVIREPQRCVTSLVKQTA